MMQNEADEAERERRDRRGRPLRNATKTPAVCLDDSNPSAAVDISKTEPVSPALCSTRMLTGFRYDPAGAERHFFRPPVKVSGYLVHDLSKRIWLARN
jgi:hypothetical protein